MQEGTGRGGQTGDDPPYKEAEAGYPAVVSRRDATRGNCQAEQLHIEGGTTPSRQGLPGPAADSGSIERVIRGLLP